MSIRIGLLAAGFSAIIALCSWRVGDSIWGKGRCSDLLCDRYDHGNPAYFIVAFNSYALGKGVKGVVVEWHSAIGRPLQELSVREVQLKNSTYIQVAEKLGHSKIKGIKNI